MKSFTDYLKEKYAVNKLDDTYFKKFLYEDSKREWLIKEADEYTKETLEEIERKIIDKAWDERGGGDDIDKLITIKSVKDIFTNIKEN